jgi:hypothetical protein
MFRTLARASLVVCVCAAANPPAAAADVVLEWNVIALEITAAAPFNPPVETRNLAIVHAAIFDAVNAITGEYRPYAVAVNAPSWASPEAAAVAAAHAALAGLYPDQQSALDVAYDGSIDQIPAGPARTRGIAIGEHVARRLLMIRAADGAAEAIVAPYTPGTRPGDWQPTPPASLPALDPGWGRVRPFVLRRGSQFRPGPPPSLKSARYTRDFIEIKEIGSIASVTRTAAQSDLARFWVATAPQNWNPVARDVAVARGFTLAQNARAFALLNLAGADAFIAAWDAKFAYDQWRPTTAIRAADTDRNDATSADPAWTPLLPTPRFPDYIAGHTTYAGAAQAVLERVFGVDPGVLVTMTSASAPGVVESYTTFKAIADDVVDARVWGGIHWRTSSVRGRAVGEAIGSYTVHRFLRPRHGGEGRDDRSRVSREH